MLHRIAASVEQEFEKSTVESCLSEVKGESRTAPARGTEDTGLLLHVSHRRRTVRIARSNCRSIYVSSLYLCDLCIHFSSFVYRFIRFTE